MNRSCKKNKCFLVVIFLIKKMNTLSYKTISVNKETAKKEWVVIDATDQVVGRLCSKVAKLIRGKYKPSFTPNVDCGDNVIIINAAKAVFSGRRKQTRFTHAILAILEVSVSILLQSSASVLMAWIRLSVTPLRVCFLRVLSVVASSTTSTSMMEQSTITRLSSQRLLILTSLNKA